MKAWEAIKMLEENPKLRFKCGHEVISCNDNNDIVHENNCIQTLNSILVDAQALKSDWQLVREPVTWQEALQAWKEGKTVICEISGCHFEYSKENSSFIAQDNKAVYRVELIEGTWYIED